MPILKVNADMTFLRKFETGRSLTRLLMFAFVCLSLAVLIVATGLLLAAHFQTEKEALYTNQLLIAEGAARAVSGFVQEKARALITAAWMTNPETTLPEQWQLHLQRLLGLQPAYRCLWIGDPESRWVTVVSRYSPPGATPPESVPVFTRASRPGAGAPTISDVYIDPVTSEPLVGIRVPVVDALREPKMLLTAEVNLKFMWQLVDRLRVGRTGYAYVVDQNGNLIAFGDTARVLRGENVSHVPTVAEFIQGAGAPVPARSARVYRGIKGSLVVGTSVPLQTPNWSIVTELPWAEAFREMILTALVSLFIIGGMAVLAAFAGAFISRRLTVPLVGLKETAIRIAQGDRELQAGIEGPEEVAQLAGAFNSMAAQLRRSLTELERRYDEVRAARDALKLNEERLRLAQEATRDGIWDNDIDAQRIYFSPQWYRMRGYEPDEFQASAKAWIALIHRDDRPAVREAVRQAIEILGSFNIEYRTRSKNGSWRWVQSRGKVVARDGSGKAVRLAGSDSDLTERKEAERERTALEAKLLQAQKMEAVGHLAGGIAHDFNNMLSIVIGNTELAMLGLTPDNPLHHRLVNIHEAGKRSAELVRQLLAFARKQTISPRVLDINSVISGMLKMLQRLIGEHIELIWKPGRDLGRVKIDPSQIDQILANLMVNSRDAIGGVGKITIETASAVFDQAYCKSHPGYVPGRYVLLAFSDNGCGMDDTTMSKAFDPFFTTKPIGKGTGLGLSTVYGIVKQNEGFINLYSEPGKGTTFRIYLPQADRPAHAAEEVPPAEALPQGRETILMVEDDPAILELGQSILEQLGYTVLAAGTPESALEKARTYKGRIDLLITDVVMPQMNGRELVRRLMPLIPDLKCLYMSGYTANVIAHHGVLDPGIQFLQKPFSVQEIAAKIKTALRR